MAIGGNGENRNNAGNSNGENVMAYGGVAGVANGNIVMTATKAYQPDVMTYLASNRNVAKKLWKCVCMHPLNIYRKRNDNRQY